MGEHDMRSAHDQAMAEGREDIEAVAKDLEYDPRKEHDDLGMMHRQDLWPHWTHLPVKRPRWQTGYLLPAAEDENVAEPIVRSYGTPDEVLARYGSLEELVADGWVVD